jgi:hypothetical protein
VDERELAADPEALARAFMVVGVNAPPLHLSDPQLRPELIAGPEAQLGERE